MQNVPYKLLIERGFHSNKHQREWLADPQAEYDLAIIHAAAFFDFFGDRIEYSDVYPEFEQKLNSLLITPPITYIDFSDLEWDSAKGELYGYDSFSMDMYQRKQIFDVDIRFDSLQHQHPCPLDNEIASLTIAAEYGNIEYHYLSGKISRSGIIREGKSRSFPLANKEGWIELRSHSPLARGDLQVTVKKLYDEKLYARRVSR